MLLLQINEALTQGQVYAMKIKDMALDYAPKVIGAFLVYIIGSWLINKSTGMIRRALIGKKYDASVLSFLVSLFRGTMLILLFLTISGMVGINITGFAAILAGAGVAIGAALNGTLGNLAGGVMLLIFKPFKLDDMIETMGSIGTVIEQGIFNTIILTSENKMVVLPNGPLSTGVIINYTAHGSLRVDTAIAVENTTDIDKARQVAIAAMQTHPKILKTPMPEVSVLKVDNADIVLAIRPYTRQPDYWDVYFGAQELVINAWRNNGIKLGEAVIVAKMK